ncbi:MAG: hypothetical protein J0H84_20140 [Rhizobiales bacterium]|nr:hypothetical protein [Hyphomicrobiales bacterium]
MSLAAIIRRAAGTSTIAAVPAPAADEEEKKVDAAAAAPAAAGTDNDAPDDPDDAEDPDRKSGETDDREISAEVSAEDRAAFDRGCAAERARISAILGSEEADGNQALAAHLAFATDDAPEKALAALKAAGPAVSTGLSARMNGRPASALGRGGEKPAPKDGAAVWTGAIGRAGVRRKAK